MPDLAEGPGPNLRVIAAFPEPGQGVQCGLDAPSDCGAPRNAPIQLRFDRFLLPSTAVRQSIRVYSGSPDVSVFLQPQYDVVERVLLYRLEGEALWEPGALYTVEFRIPEKADDFGFRAFDGAPLGSGPIPLRFDFRVAKAAPPPPSSPEPEVTCSEVLDIFVGAGCAGAVCHGEKPSEECAPGEGLDPSGQCVGAPRMGLSLDSPEGLLRTAINRVAHQTDIGGKVGVAEENPRRLGVGMPVIDPGRPGNSYLLYKLMRKPDNFLGVDKTPCESRYAVAAGPAGCVPDPAELTRLREWFVRGEPMPLGNRALGTNDSLGPLRTLQSWIRQGASLSNCD